MITASEPTIRVIETPIPGVAVLEPRTFGDNRGYFLESFNERTMAESGIVDRFVQDNQSFSTRHVLRGLHYQVGSPQGKLIRVISGEIFDVAVDLRRGSRTFGKWHGFNLSGDNKLMLWIPQGLAHGFLVVSENAHVLYKTTDFYAPQFERTLAWNDSDLAIEWPIEGTPVVSAKDSTGTPFREADVFD